MLAVTFYFDLGSPYTYLSAERLEAVLPTGAAYERGVIGVPTIAIDEQLFWGDDRLEDAAAHLRGAAGGG